MTTMTVPGAANVGSSVGPGVGRLGLSAETTADRTMLARTAAILGAFSYRRRTLSLDELTERAGLPRSTTHRLASRLVDLGWLEHQASGYCIGAWVFRAGRLASRRVRMRAVALPRIERLGETTGLPVTLAVRAQDRVVCLEHRATTTLGLPLHDGATLPLDRSALGRALVAAESDFPLGGPWPDVAVSDEETYNGIVCYAVAIVRGRHTLGALSISTRAGAPVAAAQIELLRSTAAAVGRDLDRDQEMGEGAAR